jgi:hypothetical protein
MFMCWSFAATSNERSGASVFAAMSGQFSPRMLISVPIRWNKWPLANLVSCRF